MLILLTPPTREELELERLAENVLRRFRIGGNLDGFHFLVTAVAKTVKDPMLASGVTKTLYIEIAKRYGVTPSQVERSMRTAINACWMRGGYEELNKVAGYRITERPTNAEFIDLIAAYIRNM